MRRKAMVVTAFLLAGIGVAAAAGPLAPRVLGWEQFFKLEWDAGLRRDRPVVTGYIKNDYGFPARQVQLLVDSLDGSGQVVGQKIDRLPGMLTPGTRAYFEVPVADRAPAYRVSVYSFEWVQAGGGDNR